MKIKQVAILGSGVMGGQIAAVFANANVPTLLFDYQDYLKSNIEKIAKLKPQAFIMYEQQSQITPCCYENDLTKLSQCDLVIEAIIEDFSAKQSLFEKISPYLSEQVILASNTSSLSITKIASGLSQHKTRFCGIHFFNPPRYMPLVELIASKYTQDNILTNLESFFTSELGKNILYSQDNAGFIANRIGVFSIAACIFHSKKFGLGFDTVDALTGVLLHRAKSASFRTADLVGLDILNNVLEQFYQQHTNDPWREYFQTPSWLKDLIKQKHLGNKTKIGIYQKDNNDIKVYQPHNKTYQTINTEVEAVVKTILKQDIKTQISQLKNNPHPQAQFVYAVLKDSMLYAAFHLPNIACSTRDIDWAMHWGFGWNIGLFEYWQANGITQTLTLFQDDTKPEKISPWLKKCTKFYQNQGAYSPITESYLPYSGLDVYQTQLFRPTLLGEVNNAVESIVFEDKSSKCWHQNDGFLIISFKTKLHTLNLEVIQSLEKAIKLAETNYQALIIWQAEPPFCAGANLYEILAGAKLGMIDHKSLLSNVKQKAWTLLNPNLPNIEHIIPISEVIELLQKTLMHLKHSCVPTIAAVNGLAIGGGCEVLLHCDRVVASQESYIGLVEVGVGLLPSGGGCKEMALRASQQGGDFKILAKYFEQIGLGSVSLSANQAKKMGYLQDNDVIVTQSLDLLYHAKQQAKQLLNQHYRPTNPNVAITVGGRAAKANILAQLTNMYVGNFISDYDYFITKQIADTICGGDIDPMTVVDSQYLLDLERKNFLTLIQKNKTQNRIEYMLKKHKPLRN